MGSEEEKPSLEAPSLGFRRRRKSLPAPGGEPSTEPEPQTVHAVPVDAAGGEPSTEPEPQTVHRSPLGPTASPSAPQSRRPPRRPVNAHLAAAGAGVVVGVFLVLSTFGGLRACASIRGTTSCGGGPGLAMLVLIAVVAMVLGAGALRSAGVGSAVSISVLAVALVAVESMLFLLDALDRPGGAITVVALSLATYVLAQWVTARYLEEADPGGAPERTR